MWISSYDDCLLVLDWLWVGCLGVWVLVRLVTYMGCVVCVWVLVCWVWLTSFLFGLLCAVGGFPGLSIWLGHWFC